MPRELVAVAVRTPAIREYRDEPIGPVEIRVRTEFGAPKHGTELHMYRGDSPFGDSHWDADQKIFLPGASPQAAFPRPLGNIAVGKVVEVGAGVEGVEVGDRVAGYGPLRETQRWAWGTTGAYPGVRRMPDGMPWQAAVCLDPATVALGGIRDGNVRVGDRVAVFGLGAIGLMAVQLAKLAGASFVVGVDPIAARREVGLTEGNGCLFVGRRESPSSPTPSPIARGKGLEDSISLKTPRPRMGEGVGGEGSPGDPQTWPIPRGVAADLVLDPTEVDAGLEIRRVTGGLGVDVAIETSGSPRALHHAIRGVAFGGTVAVTAWYNEFHGGLDLGREAHLNRPTFVFTRAESEPHRDHPRWNNRRLADTAWELLAGGRLACERVVQPIVPFDLAVEAYREIDEHPERSVKLGVTFS